MLTISLGTCNCGRRGTLINGGCGFCAEANEPAPVPPPAQPMTINRAIAMLIEELAEDCPAPLAQRLTLATVAADLCRLAGEPIPVAVAEALDGPTHAPIRRLVPTAKRGSYRDWDSEFCEEPA